MTFHVKLEGSLRYENPAAATAARAAMMEGRAGNSMLEEGTRVDADTIVFVLDDALPSSTAADLVDSTQLGIERALETAIAGAVTLSDESGGRHVMRAIGREFWARRWTDKQTGFHEGKPNDLLAAHIARVEAKKPRARILVPLSGKAFDLRWLAERGHEVVGIEFVWEAVSGFFEDWELDPERTELSGKPALSAKGVTLVCADMFALTPEALGRFDVVYDRAALVALEPSLRTPYVDACRSFLTDDGVTFLVAFAYDQSRAPGPPFSISPELVRDLYAPRAIETLETRSVPTSKRLADAGIPALEESAYLIG
jgi:thiopurine S-methyltransferase